MPMRLSGLGISLAAAAMLVACGDDVTGAGTDSEGDESTTGAPTTTLSSSASGTMTSASTTGVDTTTTDPTDTTTTDPTDTTTTDPTDTTTTDPTDTTTTDPTDTTTGSSSSTTDTTTTTTDPTGTTTTDPTDASTTVVFVCDQAMASYSDAPDLAIPDLDSTSTDIMVSGETGTIESMTLTLDITHEFPGDLEITLTSPSGTVIVVTTDNGGTVDPAFAGTTFADDADDPVTDHVFPGGMTASLLTPEGAMAQVRGEDPNGTWTLDLTDDASPDTGSLDSWGMDFVLRDPALTEFGPDTFNDSPAAAIDNMTPFSVDIDVDTVGTICRVELHTEIDHTFSSDLDITLTSAEGTTTTITTDNGGAHDDIFSDTLWTDSADEPATDYAYTDMTAAPSLIPEEAFAVFNGEDPSGSWTLDVVDDSGADDGTVNAWELRIYTCECLPE